MIALCKDEVELPNELQLDFLTIEPLDQKDLVQNIFHAGASSKCLHHRLRLNQLGRRVFAKMQHINLLGGSGAQMPVVGLGTWRAPPEEVENSVDTALRLGYRHIDTAFAYNNEQAIGNVLKSWIDSGKVTRGELFITTKLPSFGNRETDVERYLKLSLKNLQLDYIDLYLIHMPFALICDKNGLEPMKNEDGRLLIDFNNDNFKTWKVLEGFVKQGLIKAIGLSNFNSKQTEAIYDAADIKPAVLQVELHAYLQQKELVELCTKLNIVVTAYAPLGSPGANKHFSDKYNYIFEDFPDLLHDKTIEALSSKYVKTPGQILLKHLVHNNVVVIPKSTSPARIQQNIELFDFEIEPNDIKELDALDKGEKGRIFSFLFFTGIEQHPQYPFKSEEF